MSPVLRVSDEQCVMIMSVRKGKRLVSRLLPLLPSPQAAAVVMAIARNLATLAKKDKQDQVTTKGGSTGPLDCKAVCDLL